MVFSCTRVNPVEIMVAGKPRASATTIRQVNSYLPQAIQYFQAAVSMLKQEYKDTPTLKESLELAIKVLSKTLDSTKLSSNKG